MSIGLAIAAAELKINLKIAFAVDADAIATDAFSRNFPDASVRTEHVEDLLDGPLGGPLTSREVRLRREVGPISILVGGPPCQGHSDLNNHTRRDDSRNRLYARMARAAEVLAPQLVIVENVPKVANDRGDVVEITRHALVGAGYRVHASVVDLVRLGVPQRRRRHLLVAVRDGLPNPDKILSGLEMPCGDHPRSVAWAIRDLEDGAPDDGVPVSAFDRTGTPSRENLRRIETLFNGDIFDLDNTDRPPCHRDREHTYRSMYGRLRWDAPAQTITTGFGSMGQGRYVHPSRRRTVTPHEAARLQTLPDFVELGVNLKRGDLARLIGNAVPPFLTRQLGRSLLPRIEPIAAKPGRVPRRNT